MKRSNIGVFTIWLLALTLTQISILSAQHNHHLGCKSYDLIESMDLRFPGYKGAVESTFKAAKANSLVTKNANTTYTIPVVFHVLWKAEEDNVSDSLIADQIAVFNEEFMGLHDDLDSIRDVFRDRVGIPNIQLELAGIERLQTVHDFPSIELTLAELDSLIKNPEVGGSPAWDPKQYLNVWVVNLRNQRSGWATPPSNLADYPDLNNWPVDDLPQIERYDGIVLDYRNIGGRGREVVDFTGELLPVNGRILIHEFGHYLGLRHIWGDAPPQGFPGWEMYEGCSDEYDDGIEDTPPAWFFSLICDPSIDDCTDDDLPNMWENYMDYSVGDCFFTFTEEQVALMRAILEGPRAGLIQSPTSVELPFFDKDVVSLWPNPNQGVFHIKIDDSLVEGKITVRVSDIAGRVVLNQQYDTQHGSLQLELPNESQGVFLVEIGTNQGRTTKRVFVSRQ